MEELIMLQGQLRDLVASNNRAMQGQVGWTPALYKKLKNENQAYQNVIDIIDDLLEGYLNALCNHLNVKVQEDSENA